MLEMDSSCMGGWTRRLAARGVALCLLALPAMLYAAPAGGDAFPVKTRITHATGFNVTYHDTYKEVIVKGPWPGSVDAFRYVLYPRGNPRPEVPNPDDVVFFEVPVRSVAVMSTTFIGDLDALGLLDHLTGVDAFEHVSNPFVRGRIKQGRIAAIGQGGGVNVERVLAMAPDLFLAYILEGTHADALETLRNAGMGVALGGGYVESRPLGRCEWIKFTALFFNAEAQAEAYFTGVEKEYERLQALVAGVARRPTVLVNAPFKDVWYVAGGQSYLAQFITDAGGRYLWAEDTHTGGIPTSFEAIYARAAEADVWINPGTWERLADATDGDGRFMLFRPVREHKVFNHNRRLNGEGGDDYWESGSVKPDRVLKDLIAIFHPELLPDHEFYWYRQLP